MSNIESEQHSAELDISIVSSSELAIDNPRLRLDSQFQSRESLAAIDVVKKLQHTKIGDLTDNGCLKGKSVGYDPDGSLGVVRSGDITQFFDNSKLLKTSETDQAFYLKNNDVLISSIGQGSIGKIQLFLSDDELATVSEVSVIRQEKFEPAYVAAFLSGKYGQHQISRYTTGATGQLHLYPSDVDRIVIPIFSNEFQEAIRDLLDRTTKYIKDSRECRAESENIILEKLGIKDWTPPNPLSYIAKHSEILCASRFDSQYFQPCYADINKLLLVTEKAVPLSKMLVSISRGRQPKYTDAGGLKVVNSKHVRRNNVIFDGNRSAMRTDSSILIEKGDVLINGTGEGTIGRSASYMHNEDALPDNHVTVLKIQDVDAAYLSAFLNAMPGKLQLEREIKGSSGQIELYPNDIKEILIWDAPVAIQKQVKDKVMSAFSLESEAKNTAHIAKQAVELAIDESEQNALNYIQEALARLHT